MGEVVPPVAAPRAAGRDYGLCNPVGVDVRLLEGVGGFYPGWRFAYPGLQIV